MSTYIDGIGASENIDSSGERLSIAGMDISSLDKDGVMNWEHKSDQPSQIVGKILSAKKIFSEKDCETDRQLHFWNKIKTPYLYVMGELMDDYKDSAKEVAGMFRYDADKKGQNERSVMNFSVEGAKIHKEGIDVTRSIARKMTITALPCNKAAVAEIMVHPANKKPSIDDLFKTEAIEIEVLQVNDRSRLWELLKKEPIKKEEIGNTTSTGVAGTNSLALSEKMEKAISPKLSLVPPPSPNGVHIGTTTSGMKGFSHGRVGEYQNATAQDHQELAGMHGKIANNPKMDPKARQHHNQKAQLHNAVANKLAAQAQNNKLRQHALATTAGPRTSAGATTRQGDKLFHPDRSGKIKPPGPVQKSENLEKGAKKLDLEVTQKINPHSPAAPEHRATVDPKEHVSKEGMSRQGELARQAAKHPATESHLADPDTSPALRNKVRFNEKKALEAAKNVAKERAKKEAGVKKPSLPKNEDAPDTLNKALTAGSGMASPDHLVGGAALAKQDLKKDAVNPALAPKDRKIKDLQQKIDAGTYKPDAAKIADAMQKHPEKPLKKSKWLEKAEQEYQKWEKREEFEQFMAKRMPNLTKGEIKAIGQTMMLQKSLKK